MPARALRCPLTHVCRPVPVEGRANCRGQGGNGAAADHGIGVDEDKLPARNDLEEEIDEGRFREALELAQDTQRRFEALGHGVGQANARAYAGIVHRSLGNIDHVFQDAT